MIAPQPRAAPSGPVHGRARRQVTRRAIANLGGMAAAPFRPPWFSNVGVQLLAGAAAVYNVVQLVLKLVDGRYGEAFLSFAWAVLFGYVLAESLQLRKQQQLEAAAGDDEAPVEPTRPAEPTD